MALYYMARSNKNKHLLTKENLTSLDVFNNVSLKMDSLVSMLELPATEFDGRRSVCAELRELLRKYYPDCMLLTFGSTVNGFGLKYSDLDLLFLPFPSYCNSDFANKDKEILPVPDPAAILSGETSKDVLMKLDDFTHLKFIRSILRKEKKLVQKLNLIPAKNSPTLKLTLATTKIVCDLCASNRIVVYNSELLQLLEKIDPRVKPLVITLRYWAQSLVLLKRTCFSSYAFNLMVIFFLQNTSPPVLPPVKRLMDMSGFSRMIAGWQTAFATDLSSIPKSKNTETTGELLLHFFQFYWNFDFVQYVISPYNGTMLPVRNLKLAKDKRLNEFELASVNIQDIFILSRNVCRMEGPHNIYKMDLFTANQMLLDKSGKFKFSMLFDINVYDRIFSLQYEKYLFGKQRACFISLDYDSLTHLSKYKINSQTWYEKACQAIFDAMQYGLLMECEVIDKVSWNSVAPAQPKKEMESKNGTPTIDLCETTPVKNSPFGLELLLSLQCVVYSRVWIGRKQIKEAAENQDEFNEFPHHALKAEYNLSKTLLKNNPLIDSPQPLLCFKCECYKHGSPQISDIIVVIKPLTASKEFHQVSSFLNSYLPKTVRKILSSD